MPPTAQLAESTRMLHRALCAATEEPASTPLRRVERLLQAGADANFRGIDGNSLLHLAVQAERLDLVHALLRAGAHPDPVAPHAGTPMHHAARLGHAGMIDALAGAGATAHTRPGSGFSPLDYAVQNTHADALARLLAHGADPRAGALVRIGILHYAAAHAAPGILRLLLEAGLDADSPDTTGRTALQIAAQLPVLEMPAPVEAQIACADALIDAGANVNRPDARGGTPVRCAARAANLPALRHLLARGGAPNPPHPGTDGPLHHALHDTARASAHWPLRDILHLLLEAGADPGRPGVDGRDAHTLAGDLGLDEASTLLGAWRSRAALRTRLRPRPRPCAPPLPAL